MLHAYSNFSYTQEYLFRTVIVPAFQAYPEIAWFADDEVAATNEGSVTDSSQSWTSLLVNAGILENRNKKYIELERMLHSLICLHLLKDGSQSAHLYWAQKQSSSPLTKESFKEIHDLIKNYANTPDAFKAIEASLVYSDLGKTPKAKKYAKEHGIMKSDHDDFMETVYSAPVEVRAKVIPSFEKLNKNVQQHVLDLHLAVPLHWGHALHLEGGKAMFSRLIARRNPPTAHHVKQAFLIQVCDVAASQAHVNLQGSIAFNELTWLGYKTVLDVVEDLLMHQDPKKALLELTSKRAKQLNILASTSPKQSFILARAGAFLRLYTPNEGAVLQQAANTVWDPEDWEIIQEVFDLDVGINLWERNPTYLPAVMINLFNTEGQVLRKYQNALIGMLIVAKIAKAYQERGYHHSEEPLCFNKLAGQAREHPEYFTKEFNIRQANWSNPQNITISAPTPCRDLSPHSVWDAKKILSYAGGAIFVAGTLLTLYKIFSKKDNGNIATPDLKAGSTYLPKFEL